MKEMKMQYVQGYYRGQEDTPVEQVKKDEGGFIVAGFLITIAATGIAYMLLKYVLAVAAVLAITYYVKKYLQLRAVRNKTPHLTVNTLGKTSKLYI
jgi:hypothetical protein